MIAVEIYTACQALKFNKDRTISEGLNKIYSFIRQKIPPLKEDRFFDIEVNWIGDQITSRKLVQLIETEAGPLFGDI